MKSTHALSAPTSRVPPPSVSDGPNVVRRHSMASDRLATQLSGADHGLALSILNVNAGPGEGPAAHVHDYPEVIVVQQGQVTCVIGDREIVAQAGDVVIIGAGEPHRFFNSGEGPLLQIDIHLSDRFATKWLEPSIG
jgi:mannose-6-phosphate isomerase-like protein (cupin superfamily)